MTKHCRFFIFHMLRGRLHRVVTKEQFKTSPQFFCCLHKYAWNDGIQCSTSLVWCRNYTPWRQRERRWKDEEEEEELAKNNFSTENRKKGCLRKDGTDRWRSASEEEEEEEQQQQQQKMKSSIIYSKTPNTNICNLLLIYKLTFFCHLPQISCLNISVRRPERK